MKKLLLIFIFSIFTFHSFSQTTPWINVGAVWYYSWWSPGYGGNDKIEYTHDTVLLGHTCQILKTTTYVYGTTGPGGPIVLFNTYPGTTQYTYNNGDTVFYYVNDEFHVLYNFGAAPGDRWNLGQNLHVPDCYESVVKTDSTSTMLIGGNLHRVLYTSDSASTSSTGITGKIIEHIGGMDYLFPTGRNCQPGIIIEFPIYQFSCFSDALESYSVVAPGECANPYHVGITEQNKQASFTLYPNPAENNITITVANYYGLKLNIYNALGEMIFSEIPKDATFDVDISTFNPGMYFISIEDKNGNRNVKRFVKN